MRFFTVPERKPRTLWACHPVASCSSATDAPLLRRNSFKTWAHFEVARSRAAGFTLVSGFVGTDGGYRLPADGLDFGAERAAVDAFVAEVVLVLPMIASVALNARKSGAPTEQGPEPEPSTHQGRKAAPARHAMHACRAAEVERKVGRGAQVNLAK